MAAPKTFQLLDGRQSLLGTVLDEYGVVRDRIGDRGVAFRIRCLNGREFLVRARVSTEFRPLKLYDQEARGVYGGLGASNIQELEAVVRDNILGSHRMVLVTGVLFEDGILDSSTIVLLYDEPIKKDAPNRLVFEEVDWYRDHIVQLTESWLYGLSSGEPDRLDWTKYSTLFGVNFEPDEAHVQEVATLSRLIYGLATAFHMTGNPRYLDAAESGIEYQRRQFKLPYNGGIIWASSRQKQKLQISSRYPEEQHCIPLYEQIYALAGLAQYYRVTLDPRVMADIQGTVKSFTDLFQDKNQQLGGFFSHLSYATKKYDSPDMGDVKSQKNWNSVGDHIPAYLINTLIALDVEDLPPELGRFKDTCNRILLDCANKIMDHFVASALSVDSTDPSRKHLVVERFFADWGGNLKWGWQQNRGIVGHNLKIVWNIHRVANYLAPSNPELAKAMYDKTRMLLEYLISEGMVDGFRGGCFDAIERQAANESGVEFAWLNTKDFWQQEQCILALLIAYGCSNGPNGPNESWLDHARAAQAFYNTFFLDFDQQSVYFRTDADGSAIQSGTYQPQGSHAKSGYHTHENAFLACLYNMTFVAVDPFTLYYRPHPDCRQKAINVLPDFLPKDALKITDLDCDCPGGNDDKKPLPAGPVVNITDDMLGYTLGVTFKRASVPLIPLDPPAPALKGRIGIIMESGYVEDELRIYTEELAKDGYEVELITYLWDQPFLMYHGASYRTPIVVTKDFKDVNVDMYKGFIIAAGKVADRLRYELHPDPSPTGKNMSPAAQFCRKIDATERLVVGGICHAMELYASADLLKDRLLSCAHNVLYEIRRAGGKVQFEPNGQQTRKSWIDHTPGKAILVTGREPAIEVMYAFMKDFRECLKNKPDSPVKPPSLTVVGASVAPGKKTSTAGFVPSASTLRFSWLSPVDVAQQVGVGLPVKTAAREKADGAAKAANGVAANGASKV